MFKKFLFHPVVCSCYVIAASALYLHLAGPPRNAIGLLGALALISLAALAVFFAAAPPRYRPYGRGDAVGTLASLVFSAGMAVIVFSLLASAFGVSVPLMCAGASVIAVLTGIAAAAARSGNDE